MPAGLSRADARLLWGAVILVLLLSVSAVLVGPELPVEGSPVPSSYSEDSGGALAAYLLLGDLGFDIRRWQESPNGLPKESLDAVLILAEPSEVPTSGERAALAQFVSAGGRVLYCGANLGIYFEANAFPKLAADWEQFEPAFPSPLTAGARHIEMRPWAGWPKVIAPQLALYGSMEEPAVVVWPIGSGEVIWWAGAGPLTNLGITRADNLRLFLNTMSEADGTRRAVFWDEYFHGQRGSLWSYVERTPVRWGLVQFGILMMAIVFTFSRRSGPIVEPEPVSRQSPLEFVETMGGLYQRARARQIPVETAYRTLRLELAQRLSMPVATSDADLAKAAGERLGLDAAGLAEALDKVRVAIANRKDALILVQNLMRYRTQL